jgi:hypothetical protein
VLFYKVFEYPQKYSVEYEDCSIEDIVCVKMGSFRAYEKHTVNTPTILNYHEIVIVELKKRSSGHGISIDIYALKPGFVKIVRRASTE